MEGQDSPGSLNVVNKLHNDGRDLALLRAGHVAVLEAAMLSCQSKHSRDLDLKSLSPSPSLHISPLLQSIMDHWLQLLHQVTRPHTHTHTHTLALEASGTDNDRDSPKGWRMHKTHCSDGHFSYLSIPADERHHTREEISS